MFESSIFIHWMSSIFNYIGDVWNESVACRIFRRLAAWFLRVWNASSIIGFFRKDGLLVRIWGDSKALLVLDWFLNVIPNLLWKLYSHFQEAFDNSILFRAIRFFARHVAVLTAIFIAIDFVVPFEYWDNRYSTIAALILFGLFLIDAMTDKKARFATKSIGVFMFLFMLSIVLAQIFSVYPSLSLRFLVFYGTDFLLMLLLVSSVKSKDQFVTVLEIILAGAAICGIYGIYQTITGVPVIQSQVDLALNEGMPGRVYAIFDNSNIFAQVIVMFLPFFASSVMSSKGWQKKVIFTLAAIPLFISLLMTFSRSGYIGFVVAVLVFIFLVRRSLIPLFIILGIVAVPFLPETVTNRIATITNTQDTSIAYRFDIFKTMWQVIRDFWYTGVGLGSNAVQRVTENYQIFTKSLPLHCHDVYLQVWVETGIVGLISFLGTIIQTVKKSVRIIFNKEADPYLKNSLIAGVSGLTGILVVSLVEYFWYFPRAMMLFWVMVGLLLLPVRLAALQKEKNETPAP